MVDSGVTEGGKKHRVFTIVNEPHGATTATILNVEVQQSVEEKSADNQDNARKVLCELFIQHCFG